MHIQVYYKKSASVLLASASRRIPQPPQKHALHNLVLWPTTPVACHLILHLYRIFRNGEFPLRAAGRGLLGLLCSTEATHQKLNLRGEFVCQRDLSFSFAQCARALSLSLPSLQYPPPLSTHSHSHTLSLSLPPLSPFLSLYPSIYLSDQPFHRAFFSLWLSGVTIDLSDVNAANGKPWAASCIGHQTECRMPMSSCSSSIPSPSPPESTLSRSIIAFTLSCR